MFLVLRLVRSLKTDAIDQGRVNAQLKESWQFSKHVPKN